jgi:polysaccharide deacetylase family protein (PEP-CTERM system associated)
MKCVFSVDVEDWFHILDLETTPDVTEWETLPSRVEQNFLRLLDLFEEHQARVTCFFLGWIGKRFPHLVKEAVRRGHEIASHGYAHQLVYQVTPEAFYQDAMQSREILEDISGKPLWGYRAAGFSVTRGTEWFFDKLIEAGYVYDSSVFPASRGHGGIKGARLGPYWVQRLSGKIVEFPVSVIDVLGTPMCFFGGGYLRLFPYPIIRRMARTVLRDSRPVIFYVHPREIDADQPRLPMNWKRQFKSYVNLKSTLPKITRLLNEFSLTSFEQMIREGMQGIATREDFVQGLLKIAPVSDVAPAMASSQEM